MEKMIRIPTTDYFVGKIKYIKNDGTEKELEVFIPSNDFENRHPSFLFDRRSGNLHLHPEEKERAKECSDKIENKLNKIKECLRKKLINSGCRIRKVSSKMYDEDTGYMCASHIFDYISVYRNGISFQIMCVKFTKNEDKTIDEHICDLQFARNEKIRAVELYPSVKENGKRNRAECNCYYNAKSSFYDDEEIICSEFISFIEKNE